MEDSNRWVRLITVGLVLAALAVGYFLISGRLTSNTANRVESQTNGPVETSETVLGEGAEATASAAPKSTSAFNQIAQRNQAGVRTLPNTGFPVYLAVAFSASAIIAGFGLRKFPH